MIATIQQGHWDRPVLLAKKVDMLQHGFHGRRHLGSGANTAKFIVNVWEKS